MNGHTFALIQLEGEGWRKLPLAPPQHPRIAPVDIYGSGQVDGPVDPIIAEECLQGHGLLVYPWYDEPGTKNIQMIPKNVNNG
jgi:hypothetical protein